MSYEIKRSLEYFISQGEDLLQQLNQVKLEQKGVQRELKKGILTEGARIIATEVFESATGGRLAKKLTKAYLDQQQKEQLAVIERNFDGQLKSWLENVKSFFSTISIWKSNLKEPNSHQLTGRFDKVLEYVKTETRIRRALATLRGISNKPLIYNKDIPKKPAKIEVEEEILLPPGSPYTGFRKIEGLLNEASGYIKIIDPYVDEETLDLFLNAPINIPILLLTAFTGGKKKGKRFIKLCQKFKAEKPNFEIRKCDPNVIHDRFILTLQKGWSVGTSLKDIGKRLSAITKLSDSLRTDAEKVFDELWNKSESLV